MNEPDYRTCQFCDHFCRNKPWHPGLRPGECLNINACMKQNWKKVSPFATACDQYSPRQFYIDGVKNGELYFNTPHRRDVKLKPSK